MEKHFVLLLGLFISQLGIANHLQRAKSLLASTDYTWVSDTPLGQGSRGVVYKAFCESTGKMFVIKVPWNQADPSVYEHFLKEHRSTEKLIQLNQITKQFIESGPTIRVPRSEWVEDHGQYAIIKQLVEGSSLRQFIHQSFGSKDPSNALQQSADKVADLRKLFLSIASVQLYIGDLHLDNLIFDSTHKAWTIIDFDSLKTIQSMEGENFDPEHAVEQSLFNLFRRGTPLFNQDPLSVPNTIYRILVHDELARFLEKTGYKPYLEAQKLEISRENIAKGLNPNYAENGVPRLFKETSAQKILMLLHLGANPFLSIQLDGNLLNVLEYREKKQIATDYATKMILSQALWGMADFAHQVQTGKDQGYRFFYNFDWSNTFGIEKKYCGSLSCFVPQPGEGEVTEWQPQGELLRDVPHWAMTTHQNQTFLFAVNIQGQLLYLNTAQPGANWIKLCELPLAVNTAFWIVNNSIQYHSVDNKLVSHPFHFEGAQLVESGFEKESWQIQDLLDDPNGYEDFWFTHPLNGVNWQFAKGDDEHGQRAMYFRGYHQQQQNWTEWNKISGLEKVKYMNQPPIAIERGGFDEVYLLDGNFNIWRSFFHRETKQENYSNPAMFDIVPLNFDRVGCGFFKGYCHTRDEKRPGHKIYDIFDNKTEAIKFLDQQQENFKPLWPSWIVPGLLIAGQAHPRQPSSYVCQRICDESFQNEEFNKAFKGYFYKVKHSRRKEYRDQMVEAIAKALDPPIDGNSKTYIERVVDHKIEQRLNSRSPDAVAGDWVKRSEEEIFTVLSIVINTAIPLPGMATGVLSAGFRRLFHALIHNEWPIDTNAMVKDMVIGGIRGGLCDIFNDLIPVSDSVWMQALGFTSKVLFSSEFNHQILGVKRISLKQLSLAIGQHFVRDGLSAFSDQNAGPWVYSLQRASQDLLVNIAFEIVTKGKISEERLDEIFVAAANVGIETLIPYYRQKKQGDLADTLTQLPDDQQAPQVEQPEQFPSAEEAPELAEQQPAQQSKDEEVDTPQVEQPEQPQQPQQPEQPVKLADVQKIVSAAFSAITGLPNVSNTAVAENPDPSTSTSQGTLTAEEKETFLDRLGEAVWLTVTLADEDYEYNKLHEQELKDAIKTGDLDRANQISQGKPSENNCFPAGTKLCTKSTGLTEIEDITYGMKVLAYDPVQRVCEFKKVSHVFPKRRAPLIEIKTSAGSLFATREHPFYLQQKNEVILKDVYDLIEGDQLASQSGEPIEVLSTSMLGGSEDVYNLTVADHHNYFVATTDLDEMVLVHNCNLLVDFTEAAISAMLEQAGFTHQEGIEYATRAVQLGATFAGVKKLGKTLDSAKDWGLKSGQVGEFAKTLKLSGLELSHAKKALSVAREPYKGQTRLSHALHKHQSTKPGRKPHLWGDKLDGAMNTWHDKAMKHYRDIFTGPGKFEKVTDKGINWLEKRLPDGRGIRLQMDGAFKGFVD